MKNLILAFVKFSGLSKIGVNLVNFKKSSGRELASSRAKAP